MYIVYTHFFIKRSKRPFIRSLRRCTRAIGIHRNDAPIGTLSADVRVLDATDGAAVQVAVELERAEMAEVLSAASGSYSRGCGCDFKGAGGGEDGEGQPQEEDGFRDGRHGLRGAERMLCCCFERAGARLRVQRREANGGKRGQRRLVLDDEEVGEAELELRERTGMYAKRHRRLQWQTVGEVKRKGKREGEKRDKRNFVGGRKSKKDMCFASFTLQHL